MRGIRSKLIGIFLSCAAFVVQGYSEERKVVERFERTYSFTPDGRLEVSIIQGSVTIEAWNSPKIRLEYMKEAFNRNGLKSLSVDVNAGMEEFRVKSAHLNPSAAHSVVNLRIFVPRTARLNLIATVTGDIRISQMSGMVKALSVTGRIFGTDLTGDVEMLSITGEVNQYFYNAKPGPDLYLTTVNGTVNLYIPDTVNANFGGKTVLGSVKTNMGDLTLRKHEANPGVDILGKLGTGISNIRLNSINGKINIRKL